MLPSLAASALQTPSPNLITDVMQFLPSVSEAMHWIAIKRLGEVIVQQTEKNMFLRRSSQELRVS
jgi:hypothetical protein